ncbi:MAG: oligosaccharide flippase family protein [Thermoplasmata archaeon]|nr:MAG: oligosaccharide flippase family protein [Thermoplasmata archaeon]
MGKFSDKLVKGTLYSFISIVGVNILTLIFSVILARMLVNIYDTPEEGIEYLGIFSLLRELGQIVLPLLMLGISTALAKFIPEYQAKKQKKLNSLVNTSLTLVCLSAVIGGIVYFIFSDVIAIHIFDTPLLGTMMKINTLYIIFTVIITTILGVVQGFQKIKLLAQLNFFSVMLSIPLLIVFVYWFGIIGAIITGVINTMIFLIIVAYIFRILLKAEKLSFKFKMDRPVLNDLLKFSTPVILSVIILKPAYLFVRAYLAVATDWITVGYYKIGVTFFGLILFIPAAISVPLIPMISELDTRAPELRAALISRIIKIGMFVILPISILLGLLSEFFIWLLFGPEYLPAAEITMLMVMAAMISSFFSIVSSIMVGTGKTLQLLYIDIVHSIIFVILTFILINEYGLMGLGWTLLIVPIIIIGPYIYYLYKNDYIHLKPVGEALFVTAFFITMALMTHLYWQPYLYVMLPAILIPMIIIEYRLLTDRDKLLMKEWIEKIKGKLR